MGGLGSVQRPMSKSTAAGTTPESRRTLGRRVIEFRRRAAYAAVAALVSVAVLGAAGVAFLRARPLLGGLTAGVGVLLLQGLVRPLLSARLVIHQNGLEMTDGRRHQLVLWEDVADIRPMGPPVGDPKASVSLVIRRRSGGGIVLGDSWRPRREYRALIERLLRWRDV